MQFIYPQKVVKFSYYTYIYIPIKRLCFIRFHYYDLVISVLLIYYRAMNQPVSFYFIANASYSSDSFGDYFRWPAALAEHDICTCLIFAQEGNSRIVLSACKLYPEVQVFTSLFCQFQENFKLLEEYGGLVLNSNELRDGVMNVLFMWIYSRHIAHADDKW